MVLKYSELTDISRDHRSAVDALTYAILSLEAALAIPRYKVRSGSPAQLEMRRDMPYAIHETNLPGTYLLVNRNYKPVGSNLPTTGAWVEYEEFRNLHVRLAPNEVASVSSPDHTGWLYAECDAPWNGQKGGECVFGEASELASTAMCVKTPNKSSRLSVRRPQPGSG